MLRQALQGRVPAGLEPGSPFGPNLRAFVIYLRFTQGVDARPVRREGGAPRHNAFEH